MPAAHSENSVFTALTAACSPPLPWAACTTASPNRRVESATSCSWSAHTCLSEPVAVPPSPATPGSPGAPGAPGAPDPPGADGSAPADPDTDGFADAFGAPEPERFGSSPHPAR